MRTNRITLRAALAGTTLAMILLLTHRAFALCDTMDGPLVQAAKVALKNKDITPVLKWLKPDGEAEVKAAFNQTLAVRAKGPDARQLADQFFFETGLIPIGEINLDQNAPAIATNQQDRYMVVWEHQYGGTETDIYAREYDALGNPLGSSFTLASWTEDTTAPDIAAGGSHEEWLAVWQQDLGGGSGYAIKAFRWGPMVSSYFVDVANSAFWENENPAVAADVPGYLIVYEGDSTMTNRHIYGRMWWSEALYLPLVLRSP